MEQQVYTAIEYAGNRGECGVLCLCGFFLNVLFGLLCCNKDDPKQAANDGEYDMPIFGSILTNMCLQAFFGLLLL